ncbi:hypothetical protein [Magnetospirillum gryphiswaldense]|uniref:hypothetical protein n=1 Tax=Magnetospirillum gryphiswaldense TaxID=55518 RepID=UPI000D026462|nr:hypothetical protein [Magnetospirillum gryphiswaldense]AVM75802.1 hypothetical protein MSR1_33390 [Magnetospirillum gryphiswaldense MSR-1]AVM79705.1 hypothetical protein MSR1L_33390 [Magnetospirillum gryphiswaldense]
MTKEQNIISIDHLSELSPLIMLAVMHWTDPKQRNGALVTLAAGHMDFYNDLKRKALMSDDRTYVLDHEKFYSSTGVKFDSGSPSKSTSMTIEYLDEAIATVQAEIFEPFGGVKALIDAPGPDKLNAEFRRAQEHGAMTAGLTLVTVARLARIDSTKASLARAISILQKTIIGKDGAGDERTLKNHWKKWSCVAPFWAGALMASGYPWDQKGLVLDGSRLLDAFSEATASIESRKNTLSYSQWFRDFAVQHIPLKSNRPILTDKIAIMVKSGLPTITPPLPEFNEEELTVDRAHESPTIKKSDLKTGR